jgi:predicted lipoprotein with Yx(FWY)xxD motif
MHTLTASRIRLATGTVLALGALAACSASPAATSDQYAPAAASSTQTSTTSTTSTSEPAASAPSLKMADTTLGSVLVDGKGMTLYLFTKDAPKTSACTGQCLVNWPPLLGVPTAGAGVDDSKLGSFTRADGRVQATYNGWPLYYWIKDTKAGDTTGQKVQGVWFVLNRDGEAIK